MLEPRTRDPALVDLGPRREPCAPGAARSSITPGAQVALGLAVTAVVEGERDEAVRDARRARSRRGSPCASRRRAGSRSRRAQGPSPGGQPQARTRCRRGGPTSAGGCGGGVLHNVAAVWRLPLSATRTRSARASTSAATSRSAAATSSSWPSASALRRTSTPRTTCARGRARTSRRSQRAPTTSR